MSGIMVVLYFLVSLALSLFTFSLWLRIALRYFKISSLNSFSQLIHTVTNPLINPINSALKLKPKPQVPYDWVAFGVLVLVEFVKMIVISLMLLGKLMPFSYLVLYVLADLIIQPCNLLFYAILIRVVLSYLNPGLRHPLLDILQVITNPLLQWGRRLVPDISGFDFSPFVVLVILKIITLFISFSLPLRLL